MNIQDTITSIHLQQNVQLNAREQYISIKVKADLDTDLGSLLSVGYFLLSTITSEVITRIYLLTQI